MMCFSTQCWTDIILLVVSGDNLNRCMCCLSHWPRLNTSSKKTLHVSPTWDYWCYIKTLQLLTFATHFVVHTCNKMIVRNLLVWFCIFNHLYTRRNHSTLINPVLEMAKFILSSRVYNGAGVLYELAFMPVCMELVLQFLELVTQIFFTIWVDGQMP